MGRRHILIVDEETRLSTSLARLLDEQFLVSTCAKGRDAIARLRDGEIFDAILCEARLTDIGVGAFFAEIASTNMLQMRRLVMMSAGPMEPTSEALIRRAGAPIIDKPFTLEELLPVLSGVMRR